MYFPNMAPFFKVYLSKPSQSWSFMAERKE